MPRHLLLPCAETCLTVEASAVAIGTVNTINGFEHFRPPVTAKWAEHVFGPSFLRSSDSVPIENTLLSGSVPEHRATQDPADVDGEVGFSGQVESSKEDLKFKCG